MGQREILRRRLSNHPSGLGSLKQDVALKRPIAALQESEGRYRSLAESSPDLVTLPITPKAEEMRKG